MNNDKGRFERVIKLLSERFVDDFIRGDLWNGYYPRETSIVLNEYNNTKEDILNQFKNKKVQTAFIDFNQKFSNLHSFLIEHFSIPRSHYANGDTPPFYYLEPEYHHNFFMSENGRGRELGNAESSRIWREYKTELETLSNEFHDAYKDFISTANSELDTHKPFWKRPEIITPIIIALISVPWWPSIISYFSHNEENAVDTTYYDAGEVPEDRTINATEEYSKLRKLSPGISINKFKDLLGDEMFVNKLSNEVVEYVFVNPLYYVEAATDIDNNVLFYSITTRRDGFNPKFEFFKKYPDSNETVFVELGKTTFAELDEIFSTPIYTAYMTGANWSYYYEAYYPGRPYQTHIFSINSSNGVWPAITPSSDKIDNLGFTDTKITNEEWLEHRKTTIINTYTITTPFYGMKEIISNLDKEYFGPDPLQVMLVN